MTRAPRFLFYSHDGQGMGHTRRNLAVASALISLCPNAAVLIASGNDDIRLLGAPPSVEVLKLPSLRKVANGRYDSRRLAVPAADILALREGLLTAAAEFFVPDLMVVDKHPLGAGGELRTALESVRSRGGAAVLGLRDILDDPETVVAEWVEHDLYAKIIRHYDRVLVYGQRKLFDPIREYRFPDELADMLRFCGYVCGATTLGARIDRGRQSYRPVVLATVGAGEDGFELLSAFLKASKGMEWRAIAVAGPHAPAGALAELRGLAEEAGAELYGSVTELSDWFGDVNALVCMGGYNTLVEAVSWGTATICVPRVEPRTEQLIRARAFADAGLVHLVEPRDLSPVVLRRAVMAGLRSSSTQLVQRSRVLELNGAARSALEIVSLVERADRTGREEYLAVG